MHAGHLRAFGFVLFVILLFLGLFVHLAFGGYILVLEALLHGVQLLPVLLLVRRLLVLLAHALEFLAFLGVHTCLIICIFVDVIFFYFIQDIFSPFAF